ncbi:MAG: dihydroorotate dehydrogenase [Planctomycetota bacterium]|nr:dihydroorotate dehydrogenase [Planctomycetota bacterium]
MIDSSQSNTASTAKPDLSVQLGRLALKNPVLVASGTFGYAREMAGALPLTELGGILPKTITQNARPGNSPWRTVETSSGLLNAIGLDNDGIDYFLANHWPYLKSTGAKIIVSIAGKSLDDFVLLASRLAEADGLEAVELNVSCPNVSGGVDFGTDAKLCYEVVSSVRKVLDCAIVTKLTPNVTRIVDIARAAKDAGTDAVTCINTVLGMAVDWRKRKPMLANVVGGLSGPAIKPIALRCVYQVASQVGIPVIGVGGIANLDDVMEFLVAGASAVQIGTANYYDPLVSLKLIRGLPDALASIGASSVREIVGTLKA